MPLPDKSGRQLILANTIEHTNRLIPLSQHADASFFLKEQLPEFSETGLPLDRGRNQHLMVGPKVSSTDGFTCARALIEQNPSFLTKILVLNCCSPDSPGHYIEQKFGITQEDVLIYSSTLLHTLKKHSNSYPFDRHLEKHNDIQVGGIYSPAVIIFKDNLNNDCVELTDNQITFVSVISVAAPKNPVKDGLVITKEAEIREMKENLRLILRVGVQKRKTVLVLGALGCSEWGWPPSVVAQYWEEIIFEQEFAGFFEHITIAVGGKGRTFEQFKEKFPA